MRKTKGWSYGQHTPDNRGNSGWAYPAEEPDYTRDRWFGFLCSM